MPRGNSYTSDAPAPALAPPSATPLWIWGIVLLLFLYALAYLAELGPIDFRGNIALMDFAMFVTASRAWIEGLNPYDNALLHPIWLARGGPTEMQFVEYWISVLPPGAMVVFAPLAAMPIPLALASWLILSVGMIAAIVWSVVTMAQLTGWKVWLLAAAVVASSPVLALLAVGQPSLPAIGLMFLALERAHRRRWVLAGALLGVAVCIKPQLVAPLLLYFAFYRRWRLIGTAVVCAAAITAVAVLRMELHGHAWLSTWTANIAASSAPGANDDPTGPWRHQMVHLPVWLFTFIDQPALVNAISWVVCMGLALAYVVLLVRNERGGMPADRQVDPERDLLAVSALLALTLLPVYHKSYDAAVLALPLGWALYQLSGPMRRQAITLLALMLVFLVPFNFLPMVMHRTDALDDLAETALWRVLIFPHKALGVLAVAVALLGVLWLRVRWQGVESAVPRPSTGELLHDGTADPIRPPLAVKRPASSV